jgi:hypothetical protein
MWFKVPILFAGDAGDMPEPKESMTAGGFSASSEKTAGRRTPEKPGATALLRFLESHLGLLKESWSIAQDIAARVKMFFYHLGRRDRFGTCPRGQALRGNSAFEITSQE